MKVKPFEGKLTLKKSTICDLNKAEKEVARGGRLPETFQVTCVKTWCALSGIYCC